MFAAKNFFLAGGAGSYTVIESFLASGSWKCPVGVISVDYLVVAGGGAILVVEKFVNESCQKHVNLLNVGDEVLLQIVCIDLTEQKSKIHSKAPSKKTR